MRIPGQKRSSSPDQCGIKAGQFAEAVKHNEMVQAWDMLSRESQGVRQGVWATKEGIRPSEGLPGCPRPPESDVPAHDGELEGHHIKDMAVGGPHGLRSSSHQLHRRQPHLCFPPLRCNAGPGDDGPRHPQIWTCHTHVPGRWRMEGPPSRVAFRRAIISMAVAPNLGLAD